MKYLKTYNLFESKLNSNFHKWFKNSKVVNPNGSPRIVYHGVRAGDIEEYDNTESPIEIFDGTRGIGWFTENKNYAKNYTDSNTIMKLYLSIKNPYILNIPVEEDLTLNEFIDKTGIKIKLRYLQRDKDEYRDVFEWYDPTFTNFIYVLQDMGYDGMKTLEYQKHVCWLPFFPEQIKSVTHNNGNYEINNPNITQ